MRVQLKQGTINTSIKSGWDQGVIIDQTCDSVPHLGNTIWLNDEAAKVVQQYLNEEYVNDVLCFTGKESREAADKRLILHVWRANKGNMTTTAKSLVTSKRTLQRLFKSWGMNIEPGQVHKL